MMSISWPCDYSKRYLQSKKRIARNEFIFFKWLLSLIKSKQWKRAIPESLRPTKTWKAQKQKLTTQRTGKQEGRQTSPTKRENAKAPIIKCESHLPPIEHNLISQVAVKRSHQHPRNNHENLRFSTRASDLTAFPSKHLASSISLLPNYPQGCHERSSPHILTSNRSYWHPPYLKKS